jgi:hypothetical protein
MRREEVLLVYRLHGVNFETLKIGTASQRLTRAMMQEIMLQEGAIEVDARVLAGDQPLLAAMHKPGP